MVWDLAERLRAIRIRQSVEPIGSNQYLACGHWWSWWLPSALPVWHFTDDLGNSISFTTTYGTSPVVLNSVGPIVGGIWFGVMPVSVVYGAELDTRASKVGMPELFLLYEHRGQTESMGFPGVTLTGVLVIPQSAKWAAEYSAMMHAGMLSAVQDIMRRAMIEIGDAVWVPSYNPNLGGTGHGLPSEANTLVMTLKGYRYE